MECKFRLDENFVSVKAFCSVSKFVYNVWQNQLAHKSLITSIIDNFSLKCMNSYRENKHNVHILIVFLSLYQGLKNIYVFQDDILKYSNRTVAKYNSAVTKELNWNP